MDVMITFDSKAFPFVCILFTFLIPVVLGNSPQSDSVGLFHPQELSVDERRSLPASYYVYYPGNTGGAYEECQSFHPPRYTGLCSSSYIVVPVQSYEDRMCITEGEIVHISPQEIMSCGDFGCGGGFPTDVFSYLEDSGSPREACYNYNAVEESCPSQCPDDTTINLETDRYFCQVGSTKEIHGYQWENLMNEIYQHGPIVVTFYVYSDFLDYSGGVYEFRSGNEFGRTLTEVLGWGVETVYTNLTNTTTNMTYTVSEEVPVWYCKHHFGSTWGDQGYFLMKSGGGDGCRFGEYAWSCVPEFCRGGFSCNGVCSSFSSVCSAHGNCVSQDLCECENKFGGEWCDHECLHACVNGKCNATTDSCDCRFRWGGEECDIPICEPNCGSHGTCFEPNKCACNLGWNGTYCNVCASGYFVDTQNDRCCPIDTLSSSCTECNEAMDKCIACSDPLVLDEIFSNCCELERYDSNQNLCCPESCIQCHEDSGEVFCDQCEQPLFFLSEISNLCCSNNLPVGCVDCLQSKREICSQCGSGYFVSSGSEFICCDANMNRCEGCVTHDMCSECEEGYFVDENGNCCSESLSNCAECNPSSQTCSVCSDGFLNSAVSGRCCADTLRPGCNDCSDDRPDKCTNCTDGWFYDDEQFPGILKPARCCPEEYHCAHCRADAYYVDDILHHSIYCTDCIENYTKSGQKCCPVEMVDWKPCTSCDRLGTYCNGCDYGYWLDEINHRCCQNDFKRTWCNQCTPSGEQCSGCTEEFFFEHQDQRCCHKNLLYEEDVVPCGGCADNDPWQCSRCADGYNQLFLDEGWTCCLELVEGCTLCNNEGYCQECNEQLPYLYNNSCSDIEPYIEDDDDDSQELRPYSYHESVGRDVGVVFYLMIGFLCILGWVVFCVWFVRFVNQAKRQKKGEQVDIELESEKKPPRENKEQEIEIEGRDDEKETPVGETNEQDVEIEIEDRDDEKEKQAGETNEQEVEIELEDITPHRKTNLPKTEEEIEL